MFYPSIAKIGSGACRECGKRKWREAYQKDPSRFQARAKAYVVKNRDAVLAKARASASARYAENPDRVREIKREWSGRNPERRLDYRLRAGYGITLAEYRSMLEKQGGGCAICKAKESSGGGRLVVDHCHVTGGIRGLLCDTCNSGIGFFDENAASMRAAAEYIERAQQQAPVRVVPAMRINLLQGAN